MLCYVTVVDTAGLRTRWLSTRTTHVSYTPDITDQLRWTQSAVLTVHYDVVHQLDAGDIQIKDGYFVHHFYPSGLQQIDKNVVFVVDCSGSKLDSVKTALDDVVRAELRPGDLFNVVAYSSNVSYWNNRSVVPATPANLRSAQLFINSLSPSNAGANTNDALLRSIDILVRREERDPLATRVSVLVLITGSVPTVGISNPSRILSNVRRASGGRVSLNVFVTSSDSSLQFLDRLARQNGSRCGQLTI